MFVALTEALFFLFLCLAYFMLFPIRMEFSMQSKQTSCRKVTKASRKVERMTATPAPERQNLIGKLL